MIAVRHRPTLAVVPALALGLTLLGGCMEGSPSGSDTGTEDASVLADSGLDGGGPDAGILDAGTQYDFCDQSFFKLPIDGWMEQTTGVDLWGINVAYVTNPAGVYDWFELSLFDIETCTGYRLTLHARCSTPSLHASSIVWSDYRGSTPDPDFHCADLYSFDMETWQEVRVTDKPRCQRGPVTNGRYVAYSRTVDLTADGNQELVLLDQEDNAELVIAPDFRQAVYYDMGERYVVYSGYATEPGSVGRDIYYYDLETGITDRVIFSRDHYTYFVKTSGDHLVYMGSAGYTAPPFYVVLFNMETGEHTMIAEDELAPTAGQIHRNLVVWPTASYTGGATMPPMDIVMYDIDTALYRRITTQSGTLGPGAVFFPYLIISNDLGISSDQGDVYVANLVDLGITDAQGSLIPGDPVLEPVQ